MLVDPGKEHCGRLAGRAGERRGSRRSRLFGFGSVGFVMYVGSTNPGDSGVGSRSGAVVHPLRARGDERAVHVEELRLIDDVRLVEAARRIVAQEEVRAQSVRRRDGEERLQGRPRALADVRVVREGHVVGVAGSSGRPGLGNVERRPSFRSTGRCRGLPPGRSRRRSLRRPSGPDGGTARPSRPRRSPRWSRSTASRRRRSRAGGTGSSPPCREGWMTPAWSAR